MKPIAMRVIRGSTKCSAALPHVMSCGSQITGTRIYRSCVRTRTGSDCAIKDLHPTLKTNKLNVIGGAHHVQIEVKK